MRTAGWRPGRGTIIDNPTGGAFVTGIDAGNIVNTISKLVTGAVAALQNVRLVPSASVVPFFTSRRPAAGFGLLAADQHHTLNFDVKFTGIPFTTIEEVITRRIDVLAGRTIVAGRRVRITVPLRLCLSGEVLLSCAASVRLRMRASSGWQYPTEIKSTMIVETRRSRKPVRVSGAGTHPYRL